MGMTPITWAEIDSWLSATSLSLPVWQLLVLRDMSIAYVAEYNQASDPHRSIPYSTKVVVVDRNKVCKDLREAFKSFKRE